MPCRVWVNECDRLAHNSFFEHFNFRFYECFALRVIFSIRVANTHTIYFRWLMAISRVATSTTSVSLPLILSLEWHIALKSQNLFLIPFVRIKCQSSIILFRIFVLTDINSQRWTAKWLIYDFYWASHRVQAIYKQWPQCIALSTRIKATKRNLCYRIIKMKSLAK